MSRYISISTAVIAVLITTSIGAASDDNTHDSPETPVTVDENGNVIMTHPQLMEKMMANGHPANMPMMDMHMMQQMVHRIEEMESQHDHAYGQGKIHDMHTMGGMGDVTMGPQMMQMQHMMKMEQTMENIELLLTQLVEVSKSR